MNKTIEAIKSVAFISLTIFLLTYIMQRTYAKYYKINTLKTSLNISSWNIKVNKEDIYSKKELINKIIPVIEKDPYVSEDKIAPGTSGYCDIIIDSKDIKLPFEAVIKIKENKDYPIKDLKITDYTINPVAATKKIKNETNEIKLSIDNKKPLNTIRLYLSWDDSNKNIMNDIEDTKIATNKDLITKITLSLYFQQKNR